VFAPQWTLLAAAVNRRMPATAWKHLKNGRNLLAIAEEGVGPRVAPKALAFPQLCA